VGTLGGVVTTIQLRLLWETDLNCAGDMSEPPYAFRSCHDVPNFPAGVRQYRDNTTRLRFIPCIHLEFKIYFQALDEPLISALVSLFGNLKWSLLMRDLKLCLVIRFQPSS